MNQEALQRCAEEPIRIPGAIQPHGLFFALDTAGLRVEQVSDNLEALTGHKTAEVLGQSFLDLIEKGNRETVQKLVDEAAHSFVNPFEVRLMSDDPSVVRRFEAIAHRIGDQVTVIELEPVAPNDARGDRLDDYLQVIERALHQGGDELDVAAVSDHIVREVKKFTGFDRVMVYKFHPDDHGEVVAEALEEGMEPYLHLHYPAADIPPQARKLYEENRVRLLRDRDAGTAKILPANHPRTDAPLDLSGSVLRAMSPIHLEYLGNMGVQATLTISLLNEGKLWGLIACHHRTPRFVPYGIRATMSLFGIVMSARLIDVERKQLYLAEHRARTKLTEAFDSLDFLRNDRNAMKPLIEALDRPFLADGAAFIVGQEIYRSGEAPEESAILLVRGFLETKSLENHFATDRAYEIISGLSAHHPRAAGFVGVPLGSERWIILFRNEEVVKRSWGGDPNHEKIGPDGRLSPRGSFSAFIETVRGQSRAWPVWTPVLVDQLLGGISGHLADRERHLDRRNENLRNFAGVVAHEVRALLQAPTLTLRMMGEKTQTDPQLAALASHGIDALHGLTEFTSELLKFADMGAEQEESVDVDLAEIVEEVCTDFADFDGMVIEVGELPVVQGRPRLLHHVFLNLLRNASTHARRPDGRVLTLTVGRTKGGNEDGIIYLQDDGRGIPEEELDSLFDAHFRGSGSNGSRGHGLGLAFVNQVIVQMGGRIWVESKLDRGTTIKIRFSS